MKRRHARLWNPYDTVPPVSRKRGLGRKKRQEFVKSGPEKVLEWARTKTTEERNHTSATETTLRKVIGCPDNGTVNAVMVELQKQGHAQKQICYHHSRFCHEWHSTVWDIYLIPWRLVVNDSVSS